MGRTRDFPFLEVLRPGSAESTAVNVCPRRPDGRKEPGSAAKTHAARPTYIPGPRMYRPRRNNQHKAIAFVFCHHQQQRGNSCPSSFLPPSRSRPPRWPLSHRPPRSNSTEVAELALRARWAWRARVCSERTGAETCERRAKRQANRRAIAREGISTATSACYLGSSQKECGRCGLRSDRCNSGGRRGVRAAG